MHWVVVADASRARIFRAEDTLDRFALEQEFEHPEGRMKATDLMSDQQGRVRTGAGHPSAHVPHTDPHDTAVRAFARELAEVLQKGRVENRYERLVLAAPPRFLGMLRDELDDHTKRCVIGSLSHDWTRLDDRELPATIRAALPETAGMPDAK